MDVTPIKVLITGGAGYIGSTLVPMLLHEQCILFKIIVIDNLMYDQTSLAAYANDPNFKFVYGDVTDHEFLRKYVEWADYIIPLAGLVGMPACKKQPVVAEAVNTDHVIFCAEHGKRVIYPNTNSGYGIGLKGIGGALYCTEETPLNPISEYGMSKVAAEDAVRENGGVAFRLATVFGYSPRMRMDLLVNDFVHRAVTDKFIVLFESHFKRNYIHVKDVCRAFLFAIDYFDEKNMTREVYNLGLSSANLSKMELCLKIKECIPEFCILESDIHKDPDKRNYIVSNNKIESLGFSPIHTLDMGIKELINAYSILTKIKKPNTNV